MRQLGADVAGRTIHRRGPRPTQAAIPRTARPRAIRRQTPRRARTPFLHAETFAATPAATRFLASRRPGCSHPPGRHVRDVGKPCISRHSSSSSCSVPDVPEILHVSPKPGASRSRFVSVRPSTTKQGGTQPCAARPRPGGPLPPAPLRAPEPADVAPNRSSSARCPNQPRSGSP